MAGGDPLGATDALIALADADPDAATAPRAYLAAAAAYVDWTGADSLALLRPLPDSLVSPVLLAVANDLAETGGSPDAPRDDSDDAPPPPAPRMDESEEALSDRLPRSSREDPSRDRRSGQGAETQNDEVPVPGKPGQPLPGNPLPPPPDDRRDERPVDGDDSLVPRKPGQATEPRARVEAPLPVRGEIGPLAVADTASFTLRHHLAAVATRYPGTAYAERARLLAAALPMPPSAPPLASDSTAVADSTVAGPPVAALPNAAPLQEDDLRGVTPLDPSAGGYTWEIQRVTLADEGARAVKRLADAGYRAALLSGDPTGDLIVAVGQFVSEIQGTKSRRDLPEWARAAAGVVQIGPYSVVPTSDSAATPADPPPVPTQEAPPTALGESTPVADGLQSAEPLDPEAGGYTWRLQRVTLADEAAPMVRVLSEAGFRAGTLRNESGEIIVAVGQFGTEAEAEASRGGLPAWARIRGEVVPLDGFRLDTPADGEP